MTSSNRGDRSRMLRSLFVPGVPKKLCHIHQFWVATASKTIVGSFSFPVYWPDHAVGQFFQPTCMQSRLPKQPGKPREEFCLSISSKSSSVGFLKYFVPYTEITDSVKCFNVCRAVVSPMRTYSLVASAETP